VRQVYELFATVLTAAPPEARAAHPSSREIVAYAMGSRDLDAADLGRVAVHLRGCADCAADVETTRSAEQRGRRGEGRFLPGLPPVAYSPVVSAALAAALVLLILVDPAFLGLHRLPEVAARLDRVEQDRVRAQAEAESRLRALESDLDRRVEDAVRSALPSGPLEVVFLAPPARGAALPGMPKIRPRGALLNVGVDLDLQDVPPGPGPFVFEIRAGGTTAWTWTLTRQQIRSYLSSPQGSIIFSIPASQLPPGRYVLTMRPENAPGGTPLFEARFEVVDQDHRQSPAATKAPQ